MNVISIQMEGSKAGWNAGNYSCNNSFTSVMKKLLGNHYSRAGNLTLEALDLQHI